MHSSDDIAKTILRDREKGASQLQAEYRERLYSVAFALCHDAAEAEDLVFRTIERVIEKIDTYEERDSFYNWMCVILQNLYRDSRRSKMIQGTMPVGGPADIEAFVPPMNADAIVKAVDADIVRRALEMIPPQMREVLILHYFMDMPVKQIARTLMVAPGTVMSRLHYARHALARQLGVKLKKPAAALIAVGFLLVITAAVVVGVAGRATKDAPESISKEAKTAQETKSTEQSLFAKAIDASSITSVSYVTSKGEPPSADCQHTSTNCQLKGEQELNIKQKTVLASAVVTAVCLAPQTASAGVASATSGTMASFNSFVTSSAQTPSTLEDGFSSFVSQTVETDKLQRFNSFGQRGAMIILK
ncbi:MAG: RNA polymerase sigma factor [Kiritimatiellae bacterium]|nr:RNA polymerase sigma factor [Kiritimatiellia bacterium]